MIDSNVKRYGFRIYPPYQESSASRWSETGEGAQVVMFVTLELSLSTCNVCLEHIPLIAHWPRFLFVFAFVNQLQLSKLTNH